MTAKIAGELLKRLEETEKIEPQREIPVIVRVAAGADLAALELKGLKIQRSFESISAVSGTIGAAGVRDLAQLDQVESIEYDGEVHAL